jgi:hypothetical protein
MMKLTGPLLQLFIVNTPKRINNGLPISFLETLLQYFDINNLKFGQRHKDLSNSSIFRYHKYLSERAKTKLRGLSLQANYTDQVTVAVGEVVSTFADRGVLRGQRNGSPWPLISVF